MSLQARCSHVEADLAEKSLKAKEKKETQSNYIANQYRIFSITYGIFLCLVGIVLTTIEPFKACKSTKT
jgi:hypothetical protein